MLISVIIHTSSLITTTWLQTNSSTVDWTGNVTPYLSRNNLFQIKEMAPNINLWRALTSKQGKKSYCQWWLISSDYTSHNYMDPILSSFLNAIHVFQLCTSHRSSASLPLFISGNEYWPLGSKHWPLTCLWPQKQGKNHTVMVMSKPRGAANTGSHLAHILVWNGGFGCTHIHTKRGSKRKMYTQYGVIITKVHTNCRILCGMVFISVIP